ncbi:MAG TPA: serine/threonine-protein kinase [Terriglobia bacterium]|nr:serine/threonine-protein kinase [Terriglobia bacterium]
MSQSSWPLVREILYGALELAPHERSCYLDESCASQPASIRAEVETLLASYERGGDDFLRTLDLGRPPVPLPESEPAVCRWIGRRIGPYQVTEQVGRGGMGIVLRAIRADGQFEQEAAIKIIRAPLTLDFLLERFRHERQILAALDHPNIARLLDGGTTEDGLPYFVMEYIDGQPLDAYCDAHHLSLRERLQLFRAVCSAIQYAHQRLVVHRDIKPGNILVTASGAPKLLDFGIAKILDAKVLKSGEEPEATLAGMATPTYASPEQIRGGAITTATDIYSLGVLLYELLTGKWPYHVAGSLPHEIARAVCEAEPEKPSHAVTRPVPPAAAPAPSNALRAGAALGQSEKLRRQLTGDLDNIILRTLSKEPERRYATVQQLAEDIHRHLEGLPVIARRATLSYRTEKFVKRHKVKVVAAAFVLLALLLGFAATFHEARIAETERARAEKGFDDVRQLANTLIFDIGGAIRDLPGSTPARQLLAKNALHYLDSLAGEAGGNPSLERDLASAYERLGDVQGHPRRASLGNLIGALADYRKALGIRESLLANEPHNTRLLRELARNYSKIEFCLDAKGDFREALGQARKALKIDQSLAGKLSDPKDIDELAGNYQEVGWVLQESGDLADSLDNYRKAAAIREKLVAEGPGNDTEFRSHLAGTYGSMSEVLLLEGDFTEAIGMQRRVVGIMRALSGANPNNATLREHLAEAYYYLGQWLERSHDAAGALKSYQQAFATFQDISFADPHNVLARRFVGFSLLGAGGMQVESGNPRKGLARVTRALAIFEALRLHGSDNEYIQSGFADSYYWLGRAHAKLASRSTPSSTARTVQWHEALGWYKKSLAVWTELAARHAVASIDRQKPGEIREEIASCDRNLAQLPVTASR